MSEDPQTIESGNARPATVVLPCGCCFSGREFLAAPECVEHVDDTGEPTWTSMIDRDDPEFVRYSHCGEFTDLGELEENEETW